MNRRLGIGIGAGLVFMLAVGLGLLAWRYETRFARQFRAELGPVGQVSFDLAVADPGMRGPLLRKAEYAYRVTGWRGATEVFWHIIGAKMNAYASDAATERCETARLTLTRSVSSRPRWCKRLINRGEAALPADTSPTFVADVHAACDATARDGEAMRRQGGWRRQMSFDEANAYIDKAYHSPVPLTDAQIAALMMNGPKADPVPLCGGAIQHSQNLLADPEQAGEFFRGLYSRQDTFDAVAYIQHPRRYAPAVPADFHCAPPGTVLHLTIFANRTGLPIVWTAAGQNRFDCTVNSSLSGSLLMWHTTDPALSLPPENNPFAMLWPFAINKTVRYAFHPAVGDDIDATFRVLSYQQYPVPPLGEVWAYAIEEQAVRNGGESRYRVISLFAPSLGELIGHHITFTHGAWPTRSAPDWTLFAVDPAPTPAVKLPG